MARASCNTTRDATSCRHTFGEPTRARRHARDSSNDIVKAPVKVAVDLAALWIAGSQYFFLGSAAALTSLNLRRVRYKYGTKFLI